MHHYLLESGTKLAARIRKKEVSSEELVSLHIDRAKATHGAIHAIVADRYEAALREARAADERIANGNAGELPPFFGVPCSIKECFALTGMPQTSGLVSRKDYRADHDAPAVKRLRDAGAIPIGVTNTSELCMWMESSNKLYGRTSNPYDTRRIVGGSSGGEAAIIAAGAAPFGLGSDIGGSIRMPAFFCGIFGHKPSPGVVPNEGQFPQAHGTPARLLATGPMARRSEDLWPLLSVLAADALPEGDPDAIAMRDVVVLDVKDNGRLRVSDELRTAQVQAAHALAKRGAKVRELSSDRFKRSIEMWAARMSETEGGPTFGELMGGGAGAVSPWREMVRWAVGRSDHTLPAIGLAALEHMPALSGPEAKRLATAATTLRHELEDAMGDRGVILFPSYTRTAPRHSAPILFPVQWMYTALFNALELPVTQVPLGLDRRGVPLGVQVVTKQRRDCVSIAVGRALEEDFGGWLPPRDQR